MSDPPQIFRSLLLFKLGDQRFALRLDAVERVIRAVAVTPVPELPSTILGLINVAGRLVPVFSLRGCLNLPDRPVGVSDQFILVRTRWFQVALVVDEVLDVSDVGPEQAVDLVAALPEGATRMAGLVKIDGDVVLIYDLETLLRPEERELILQATAAKAVAEELQ